MVHINTSSLHCEDLCYRQFTGESISQCPNACVAHLPKRWQKATDAYGAYFKQVRDSPPASLALARFAELRYYRFTNNFQQSR
ncbi:hypothetical protein Y032_0289g1501 [Ancylostoma ceylanicum]|uniref:Uncharacterized protein n=1 Tax=Ancylostoma ceylanicum TaxID=53326 RepID=A0A016S5D8_9BILA|nr:hypothetical protein Y032_0289g1501 [Ancylostoma ceylanicum]